MKKRWIAALICTAMLLTAAAAASAAETGESGFYNVGSALNVEILPTTARGEAVTGVYQNVDGEDGDELFFPGSCALRITLADTVPGKLYILTVSSAEDVFYADQQTGGGAITFSAAFALPGQPRDMTICIGSNGEGFTMLSIPLAYTPSAVGSAETDEPLPPSIPEPSPVPPSDPIEVPPSEPAGGLPSESGAGEGTGYADCPRDGSCVTAAFSDLDPGAWYHDGVHWALENDIMKGVSSKQNEFAPGISTNRAMIVTMLYRMEGEPRSILTLPFEDVPAGKWYTEAVRWATGNGIVTGYSSKKFGPDDVLTREQLVTILERYARYKGLDTGAGESADLNAYRDWPSVAKWAIQAMRWGVDADIVNGGPDGRLGPKANATRAQVATMLMRFGAIEQ